MGDFPPAFPHLTSSHTESFNYGFNSHNNSSSQDLRGLTPGNHLPVSPLAASNGSPFPSSFNLQSPQWAASSPFGSLTYPSASHTQWTPQSRPFHHSPDLGYASATSSPANSSAGSTPMHPPSLTTQENRSSVTESFPFQQGEYFAKPKALISDSKQPVKIPVELPVNRRVKREASDGKPVIWYFLLRLLIDPTKKSVIVWTGNGKEFRIINCQVFCLLWSQSGEGRSTNWETVQKNIRNFYGKTTGEKVLAKIKRGVPLYKFVTEPSVHVGMTPDELDIYIALNHENGPLTTGFPIQFALPAIKYPKGTKLPVNRIVPLHNDGSPAVNLQPEYIEVTLNGENSPAADNTQREKCLFIPFAPNLQPFLIDQPVFSSPYDQSFPRATPHNFAHNYSFKPY